MLLPHTFTQSASRCVAVVLVLGVFALAGCTVKVGGSGLSLDEQNDALRRTNLQLNQQLKATQTELGRLESELILSRRERTTAVEPIEGAVIPVLVALDFARYTGPLDLDDDGVDDELRLYLRPLDQFGRMLVVAAEIDVQVVALSTGQPPRVVIEKTFSAPVFRDAYRTALTGDHFSLTMPLEREALRGVGEAVVHISLTNAADGSTIALQQVFTVRGS